MGHPLLNFEIWISVNFHSLVKTCFKRLFRKIIIEKKVSTVKLLSWWNVTFTSKSDFWV